MIPTFVNETMMSDKNVSSVWPRLILLGYRGSIAHDTYEENTTHDDYDLMGVFIPTDEAVLGLDRIETIERMFDEKLSQKRTLTWDIVLYSLQKYISLLCKQNPNVLSLLWIEERFFLKKTSFGEKLISARNKFLTKGIYKSFSGYAYGQLHRMTHVGPSGQLGKKRKELITAFGYDVKNASHLIRLLKMGIEALVLGELIVSRPDNNMLLEIKRGQWPLKKVLDLADELFKNLDTALLKSELEKSVNYEWANKFCAELMRIYLIA